MSQAFRKIQIRNQDAKHRSKNALDMQVAHSLSKDVRLQKTRKCARSLTTRICLDDDPITRDYKDPQTRSRGSLYIRASRRL